MPVDRSDRTARREAAQAAAESSTEPWVNRVSEDAPASNDTAEVHRHIALNDPAQTLADLEALDEIDDPTKWTRTEDANRVLAEERANVKAALDRGERIEQAARDLAYALGDASVGRDVDLALSLAALRRALDGEP